MTLITRRTLVGSLGVTAGGLLLSGCDRIVAAPKVKQVLSLGEGLTMRAQRLVSDRTALAREFSASDMSPFFRTNGNTMPGSNDYATDVTNGFADWRLRIVRADPLNIATWASFAGQLLASTADGHLSGGS